MDSTSCFSIQERIYKAPSWCAIILLWWLIALPVSADNRAIIERALELEVGARLLEQKILPSKASHVSVYVGLDEQSWVLQSVTVRLNRQLPVQYHYTPLGVGAMHQNGLHKIAEWVVGQGVNHISAKFIAVKRGSSPTDVRTVIHLDKELKFEQSAEHIELNLAKTGFFKFFRKPRIQLRQWRRES